MCAKELSCASIFGDYAHAIYSFAAAEMASSASIEGAFFAVLISALRDSDSAFINSFSA